MSSKRLPGVFLGAFMVLALTGCGTRQNPHWFYTGRTPWFFNGLWDGLWAPILFIQDLLHNRGYQLYSYGHPAGYFIGYLVGVCVCLAIIYAVFLLLGELLAVLLPLRTARLADALAVVLTIILVLIVAN